MKKYLVRLKELESFIFSDGKTKRKYPSKEDIYNILKRKDININDLKISPIYLSNNKKIINDIKQSFFRIDIKKNRNDTNDIYNQKFYRLEKGIEFLFYLYVKNEIKLKEGKFLEYIGKELIPFKVSVEEIKNKENENKGEKVMVKNQCLEIKIGDEYLSKVESIENFEQSFFSEVYFKAFKSVEEIVKNNTEKKEALECEDYSEEKEEEFIDYENYNNIIAFTGERGTGKTSAMLSVSKALKFKNFKKNKESNFMKDNNNFSLDEYKFLGLKVIDPSHFQENRNIIEIILAKMFEKFKESVENCENENNGDKREVIKCFEEVYKNLKSISKKDVIGDEEAIDTLLKMSASSDLKGNLEKLTEAYLDFMDKNKKENKKCGKSKEKNKVLLLEIDDLDLNTKYAYEMIEQIRKYLIIKNVVILMAVKIEQLSLVIEKNTREEFKDLIKAGQISDEKINIMSDKYLKKLIPLERRLYMPNLEIESESKKIKIIKRYKNEEEKEIAIKSLKKKEKQKEGEKKNIQEKELELKKVISEKLKIDCKYKKDNFYANADELQELIEYLNKNEIKYSKTREKSTEESREKVISLIYEKTGMEFSVKGETNFKSLDEVKKLIEFLDKMEEVRQQDDDKIIDKKVRSLIYEKTGMEFIEGKYIVPNNLRDLINIISFLEKMPDLTEEEQKNITRTNNFLLWKEYIFEIWIKKYLSIKQQQILKELYERDIEEKNKYIINKVEGLYDLLEKDDKFRIRRENNVRSVNSEKYTYSELEYQDIINLNNNPQNICLGDVLFVLNKVKKYKVELQDQRFIYAIKMVYSIMLSEIYELSKEKEQNKPIFKENIIYYDYQKLLGGYLYPEKKLMRKSRNRLIFERKNIEIFIKELNSNFSEQEIYKFFDAFRVKTDKVYYQEKRKRESRKLEEALYEKVSIKEGEKIEFDILGFLFNIKGNDFYIKNIEILEKIISRNYKGNIPNEYVKHLEKFINEYKKPIRLGFENKRIELIKSGDTISFVKDFILKLNEKDNISVRDSFNKLMSLGVQEMTKNQEVTKDIVITIVNSYLKNKKTKNPNKKLIDKWIKAFQKFKDFENLKGNFNKKEFLKKINEIKSEDLIIYNESGKKVDQGGVTSKKEDVIEIFKKTVEDYFKSKGTEE